LTLYTLSLFASGLLSLVLAVICLRRKKEKSVRLLGLALLFEAWWSINVGLSDASPALSQHIFFSKISYLGIYNSVPFFLLYSLYYARLERLLTRRNIILLWIIPVFVMLAAMTNEFHHLIWTDFIRLDGVQPTRYIFLRGPLYWLGVVNNYVMFVVISFIFLVKFIRSRQSIFYWQAFLVLIGILPIWIANAMYVLVPEIMKGMDFTPIAFSLTGVMILISIPRFGILDITPVAYEGIFQRIHDGIIILDEQKRIIDVNQSGERYLSAEASQLIGQPASSILKASPALLAALDTDVDYTLEISNVYPRKYFENHPVDVEARVSHFADAGGKMQGHMIIFRDFSARKRAEQMEREQRLLSESLREIAAAMNSTLNFEEILDGILDYVSRLVPYDTANIMMFNHAGKINVSRYRGYREGGEASEQIASFETTLEEMPYFKKMVDSAQPIIIPNTSLDPEWRNLQIDTVRSYAAIPILLKWNVIGVINLNGYRANIFNPSQMGILRSFADQVAIAITNAALMDDMRQINEHLQNSLHEVHALEEELLEQAVRDALTGLFNRRYLEEALEREIARARRAGKSLGMIILDIDNFKKINDEYGHLAGDMVLKELGDLLVANSRAYDIVCRFGGEEFIIVMPGIDRTAACERAESLRVSFETLEIKYEANTIRATISLGVTVFPDDGPTGVEMLSRADRALYQAKHTGRNRVVSYQAA